MLTRIRHFIRHKTSRLWWLAALLLAGVVLAADHVPLAEDDIHDPSSPAIKLLQQPEEALSKLPPDAVGNRVRWVKALDEGLITPRSNILPDTQIFVLDMDVIMPRTGEMPMVRFPHKQHTAWLDCSNCHEGIFKPKAGGNPGLNMFSILQGEYCGLCHGAVAFPLTECSRCHSVVRK